MPLRLAKNNAMLGKIVDFYLPNERRISGICRGATKLCKKYCYGNSVFSLSNDENKYLKTDKIALENYRISLTDEFEDLMCDLLKTITQNIVRIHSIGEFYSYEYFLKWIRIMERNPQIQFVAYTKAFDLLKRYKDNKGEKPSNFNVLLSLYPDTFDHYLEEGGARYVIPLLEELKSYYQAKLYVVCSKEKFLEEINKNEANKYFCNGGTNILLRKPSKNSKNYESEINVYMKKREHYLPLFDPEESCEQCMKCYSNDVVKSGDTIYALLRAGSKLANLKITQNNIKE